MIKNFYDKEGSVVNSNIYFNENYRRIKLEKIRLFHIYIFSCYSADQESEIQLYLFILTFAYEINI